MSAATRSVCLTIAGLDPSGGAGVIADIKTFRAFGCFPTAAITSLTYQNTKGVFGAEHMSAEIVRRQIEPILDDLEIAALKTGMLPTRDIIESVGDIIRENSLSNVIVDPVVRSTSGHDLIDSDAISTLIRVLFPLADLITPNIPETERITGIAIEAEEDIYDAAAIMRDMGARNVLIKGGHRFGREHGTPNAGSVRKAIDTLFIGKEKYEFSAVYIETTATHGTGCTLASAIAANLGLGKELKDAVQIAKDFVTNAILAAPMLGHGNSPIDI